MWELLAPAGSYESIIAAVNAGADAVYAGGRLFGARAYADNPDEEHLIRGIEYCHLHGRKLYLTVNTLLKERELEDLLYPYLLPYCRSDLDGVIVQDFGVMRYVRRAFPGLAVHASTQMTVTGSEGARLLQEEGVSRVVLARELSLEEIRTIIEETGIETEVFIHGAMCYSYSGQCLFSSLLGGRSGNRGRCAQTCRLPFRPVGSPEQGMCLLSMKDMCTLDLLPELLDAGITSLKIEGRMKRPEYTAGVVSVYRKYLDFYKSAGRETYHVEETDRRMLLDLYNRGGFSEGYFHTDNGRQMMSVHRPNHMGTAAVRVAAGNGKAPELTALEPLEKGDVIELAPGREYTLSEKVRKGDPVRMPPGAVRPGNRILYRTKNTQLLEGLAARYLAQEPKEQVRGELVIVPDAPAVLRLECRGVRTECVREIAEPALSRPTDEASVRRQMLRTGGTPFEFEQLRIHMSGELFLPVAALNDLRRTALLRLQEELLAHAGRDYPMTRPEQEGDRVPAEKGPGRIGLNVLVTTEEQLNAVLESDCAGLDTVYLDSMIFGRYLTAPGENGGEGEGRRGRPPFADPADRAERERQGYVRGLRVIGQVRQKGLCCFLNCPPVLRRREKAFFSGETMQALMRRMDGFLVHTADELYYFRNYIRENNGSAVLAADETLYAYNRRAAGFLRGHGVSRLAFPAELNFRELLSLREEYTELTVYGYQALMQSAQCVVKNTTGCTGVPGVTFLRDRKNADFPVLNRCPFCCNTIYNSVPLMLCGCREELSRLAPSFVRLSFTIESAGETARILNSCVRLLSGAEDTDGFGAEGTRGHFKRGVE